MNAADVTAFSACGSLLVVIMGAVFRSLVSNIVRKEIAEQNKWISRRFDKLDRWQVNHMARGHNEQSRRR
jgi:hypothetical protein